MVSQIVTKFVVARKPARKQGALYRSPRIYLSTKLTDDSVFPFREGDFLLVKIVGRRLVIQRISPRRVQSLAGQMGVEGGHPDA
jgi:hypothetical protein